MFKNFDKVFKFTFKNQTGTNGFKVFTAIVAILFFAAPVIIFAIMGYKGLEEKDEIESCGADKVYVVDEFAPDADFSILGTTGVAEYDMNSGPAYINAASVEEALDKIKAGNETKSLILFFEKDENTLTYKLIIPESSELDVDKANNFSDFLQSQSGLATVLASGIPMENIVRASLSVDNSVYKAGGFAQGEDIYADSEALEEQENGEVRPIFGMVLLYATIMLIYFVILFYGNNIINIRFLPIRCRSR